MTEEDWQAGFAKSFALFLNGGALRDVDADGDPLRDDSFLLIFNAHHEPISFMMPPASFGAEWRVEVDTASEPGESDRPAAAGTAVDVLARAMLVLSTPHTDEGART